MRKLLFAIISIAIIFASCSKDKEVTITVKYIGTDFNGGDIDLYVGIVDGLAYNLSSFDDLKILETSKITPSEQEQSKTFKVTTQKSYTAFVFHDNNKNGVYDPDEDTVRIGDNVIFIEESTTLYVYYNY